KRGLVVKTASMDHAGVCETLIFRGVPRGTTDELLVGYAHSALVHQTLHEIVSDPVSFLLLGVRTIATKKCPGDVAQVPFGAGHVGIDADQVSPLDSAVAGFLEPWVRPLARRQKAGAAVFRSLGKKPLPKNSVQLILADTRADRPLEGTQGHGPD